MPSIMPVPDVTQDLNAAALAVLRQSTRMQLQPHMLSPGAHHCLVTQQAINCLIPYKSKHLLVWSTPHA
jgi:hypothetical protein